MPDRSCRCFQRREDLLGLHGRLRRARLLRHRVVIIITVGDITENDHTSTFACCQLIARLHIDAGHERRARTQVSNRPVVWRFDR